MHHPPGVPRHSGGALDAGPDLPAATPAWRQPVAAIAALRQWLAVPQRCRVCHGWPAQTLCTDCVDCFADDAGRRCARCALPLPPAAPFSQCVDCLLHPPALSWALARQDYRYPWPLLLSRLKFGGDIGLARALGRHLAGTPGLAARLADVDAIVPLPLARERLAERGFNQSAALARAMAAAFGRPALRKLRPALLDKHRHTPPQHDLPRHQRLANVHGAYRVPPAAAALLPGRCVLLVDDVMTTGASLDAAARTLRQAGAREVGALVLMRA